MGTAVRPGALGALFVAAVVFARAARADGPDVPSAPLSDASTKTLRDAVEAAMPDVPNNRSRTAERAKELAALDRLRTIDLPDTTRLERVRVVATRKDLREPIEGRVWRVPAAGPPWTVVLADFSVCVVAADRVVSVEPVSHVDELKAIVADEASPSVKPDARRLASSGPVDMLLRGEFVRDFSPLGHAMAAVRAGDAQAARVLVAAALRSEHAFVALLDHLPDASYRRGARLLHDGGPWRDVLAAWRDTAARWPAHQLGALAKEHVAILEVQVPQMEALAEERAPKADAPVTERIASLVARLVESPGHDPRCIPGDTVFVGPRGERPRELVEIGRDALPALIERLDDTRLTRAFERGDLGEIGDRVLRVQDAALECIHRVTGLRFGEGSWHLYRSSAEDRARLIDGVRSWHRENGAKPWREQVAARLFVGNPSARLNALVILEKIAPGFVDSRAVMRRWAVEGELRNLPWLAAEAAKRGDLSLLVPLREAEKQGHSEERLRILLRHPEPGDIASARDALRESRARLNDEFARHRLSAIVEAVRYGTQALHVPLLVDLLDARSVTSGGSRPGEGGNGAETAADAAMAALVSLTGHNDGHQRDAPAAERFAAIDRWLAWWAREGRAAFTAAHPEVAGAERAGAGTAPPTIADLSPMVDVLDPIAELPVVLEVPRDDVLALLGSGDIVASRRVPAGWSFAFSSAEAAARWFDRAKPIPKPASDAKPVVTLVDDGVRYDVELVVDPRGLAWMAVWAYGATAARWRESVEIAAREAAAGRAESVRIEGARLHLFDRDGVLWLSPSNGEPRLAGFDPRSHAWIEAPLRDEQGATIAGPVDAKGAWFHLVRAGFQSSDGTLFFADGAGVHRRAHGTWSYARLLPSATDGEREPGFSEPRFLEDPMRRVWFWARQGCGRVLRLAGDSWATVVDLPTDAQGSSLTVVPTTGDDAWLFRPHPMRLHDGRIVAGDDVRSALEPALRFRWAWAVAQAPDGVAYVKLDEVIAREPLRADLHRALRVIPGGQVEILTDEATALIADLNGPPEFRRDGGLWGVDRAGRLRGIRADATAVRTIPATRWGGGRLIGLDGRGALYVQSEREIRRVDVDAAGATDEPPIARLPTVRLTAQHAWPDATGRPWLTIGERGADLVVLDGARPTIRQQPSRADRRLPSGVGAARVGAGGSMILLGDGVHLVDDDGWVSAPSLRELLASSAERIRRALATPPPRVARNTSFHAAIDDRGALWFANSRGPWGVVLDGRTIDGRSAGLPVGGGESMIALLEPVGGGRVFVQDERNDAALVEVRSGHLVPVDDFDTSRWMRGGGAPFDAAMRDRAGALHVASGRGAGVVTSDGPARDDALTASGMGFLGDDRFGGRWWYDNRTPRTLVRRAASGRESTLVLPRGPEMLALAEAPDGSMWTWDADALLRVAAGRTGDGELAIVERYEMRTGVRDLWCDAKGRVWLFGDDERRIHHELRGFATTPDALAK